MSCFKVSFKDERNVDRYLFVAAKTFKKAEKKFKKSYPNVTDIKTEYHGVAIV